MHHSWTLALCLSFSLHAVAVLAQSDDGAGNGPPGADDVDHTSMEYLQHISEIMDEAPTDKWNDRWQDGQFNLLPDSMINEGFADAIHCFKPKDDQAGKEPSNKKTLYFDFSDLKPTVQYTAFQLVLKLLTQPPRDYTINLYGGGDSSTILDSQTVSANIPALNQEWLVFTVHQPSPESWTPHPKDNYMLTLELTSTLGEPISVDEATAFYTDGILPRLVIYAYDNQTVNIKVAHPQDNDVPTVKRSASSSDLRDLYRGECAVRSWHATWSQLGWPGDDFVVFKPSGIQEWTFCYGHCNSPLGNPAKYTQHARILQSLNIFKMGGEGLPPPGCVPGTLTPHHVHYYSKKSFTPTLGTFYRVLSCNCQ